MDRRAHEDQTGGLTVVGILAECGPDPRDVQYLDWLVGHCGHFTVMHANGFGCTHPDQEQQDEDGQGSCFSSSCPVACRLLPDHERLDVKELEWRGWSDDEIEGVTEESDLMLIHDENLLKKVRAP